MDLTHVLEAEFIRCVKAGLFTEILLIESKSESMKFHIIGIKSENGIQVYYSIRHARQKILRAWQLNNGSKLLKRAGGLSFSVRMQMD